MTIASSCGGMEEERRVGRRVGGDGLGRELDDMLEMHGRFLRKGVP